MKIRVKRDDKIKRIVPGFVFQQPPFDFFPVGFSIKVRGENDLLYPKSIQEAGLKKFLSYPFGGQNYVLTSFLDDSKPLYMAAFLVQAHLSAGGTNPVWVSMTSSYRDDLDAVNKPSMLVLSNLTSESSPVRLEKCRDLTFRYYDVPKIIVGCGLDPIHFGGTKLHIAVNKMVYFKSGLDVGTTVIE